VKNGKTAKLINGKNEYFQGLIIVVTDEQKKLKELNNADLIFNIIHGMTNN